MRSEMCRCGHERPAHDHYRPGTECALCAAGECVRFDRIGKARWLASRLVGVLPKPGRPASADRGQETRQRISGLDTLKSEDAG